MDYYQTLGLESNASLEQIKKYYRELVLRYHPDRNKDPDATAQFIKINEAYEVLCKEKTGMIQTDFVGLLIKPGRVSIAAPGQHSYVELKQGEVHFYGTLRTSQDKRYCIVFSDGHGSYTDSLSSIWINGKVVFIDGENLLWVKEFERPWNGSVSNNGRVALIYSLNNNLSDFSSTQEYVERGSMLVVFDKLGEEIFSHKFDSNSFDCVMSSDGSRVIVNTFSPDNSKFYFDLSYIRSKGLKTVSSFEAEQEKGYWKYKNHSRYGVHKLRFVDDIIEVFTRDNIASCEREYALYLDGTLLPKYEKEVEYITKIKKQRGEEKLESIMTMINSKERREIIEGLSLLASFVNTKGSIPHYAKIIQGIIKFIDTIDSELFSVVWQIIKGILKKEATAIEPLVEPLISKFKMTCDDGELLVHLGELGKIVPKWVLEELPLIKQKLTSKVWNERRLAAFAIGYIGAVDIRLIDDVIPLIIEYIAKPEELASELEQIFKSESEESVESMGPVTITVSREKNHLEDATWIRDACIDTIGEIGKNFPESVEFAVPLLEEVSKTARSPYTVKKAIRAIDAINGKCNEMFRHSV